MDKGMKFLECTSPGTVAFASDQAYGEWEFDVYRTAGVSDFDVVLTNYEAGSWKDDTYWIRINSAEAIFLQEGSSTLIGTADGYLSIGTWYRLKITRTLDGEFYFYIKGGAFGTSDWTLVDVSGGAGTNPATDTSGIVSTYFVPDFTTGDRIANLVTRKAVKQ